MQFPQQSRLTLVPGSLIESRRPIFHILDALVLNLPN